MADQAQKLRELSQVSASSRNNPTKKRLAQAIAVTSGKGGVGKSTFTINLALALAAYEKKVLIVDADLGMANIDIMLGSISQYSIWDLVEKDLTLAEVITRGPRGIQILPGGSGISNLFELNNSQLQKIITQAFNYDDELDFILFDTGAGVNHTVLKFLLAADDVLLVTNSEPTSLTDAYSIIKAYVNNSGQAPLRLVVNRALSAEEGMEVAAKLSRVTSNFLNIKLEHLGYILDDNSVPLSIRAQNPLILEFPDSLAANCIENIACQLVCGTDKIEKKGLGSFFKKFFNFS